MNNKHSQNSSKMNVVVPQQLSENSVKMIWKKKHLQIRRMWSYLYCHCLQCSKVLPFSPVDAISSATFGWLIKSVWIDACAVSEPPCSLSGAVGAVWWTKIIVFILSCKRKTIQAVDTNHGVTCNWWHSIILIYIQTFPD